jgi:dCTP deaminase
MTFWSGETLEANLPNLVIPYDAQQIDCNAYTLRMGTEYYCTSDGKRPIWKRAQKTTLCPGDTFAIPAGQFAYLLSMEEITVPKEAMAFISMKSRVKWKGLINVSGFHVDPGYKGKLVFAAYNAGSSAIVLEAGMPLFLIWYASLDRNDSAKIKSGVSGKSISGDLIGSMSKEILSLQSVSKEIAGVKSQMRYQWAIFATALLLFLGTLGATANFSY